MSRNISTTATVTRWDSKDEKFMHWRLIDDKITCESKLVVPDEFKHEFFNKVQSKRPVLKRKRNVRKF
jgi:hypothetical protein